MSELLDTPLDNLSLDEWEELEQANSAEDEKNDRVVPLTPEQAALVAEHVGLVGYVLKEAIALGKMGPYTNLRDDFAGSLQLELCRTATRFDPTKTKGATFATYAVNRLRHEVTDIIRSHSRLDGRPRSAVQRYKDSLKAAEESPENTAAKLEKSLTVILSMDELRNGGNKDGYGDTVNLADQIADTGSTPEAVIESEDFIRHVMQLINELDPRTREIAQKYLGGARLWEIGEEQGVTEGRICQIYAVVKQSLRTALEISETSYDERTLADKVLGDLLRSENGTFSARPGADVIRRITNQTGVPAERVSKVIQRLRTEGYVEIDYIPRSVQLIKKLSLTLCGRALEVVAEPAGDEELEQQVVPAQHPYQKEQSADDILAAFSSQLSISSPT